MSLSKSGVIGIASIWLLTAATGASAALPSSPVQSVVGLAEPLVVTRQTTDSEDHALSLALAAFRNRSNPSDLSSLTGFLAVYPHSGWASALWANVGLVYLHDGYFSHALNAFQQSWAEGDNATSSEGRALVDHSIGDLADLEAHLGHVDDLRNLFAQVGDRKISGSATEAIQTAREMLTLAGDNQSHIFNCGPLALRALMIALHTNPDTLSFLQYYKPGPQGTSLTDLGELADRLKLDYRFIRREPGQAVPMPSIVHWKVGHFAAIVGQKDGRYHVQDAVFPNADIWVTADALNAEASGDFLVPVSAKSDASWKTITLVDAAQIRGRGPTNGSREGGAGDQSADGPGPAPTPPNLPNGPPFPGQTGSGNGGQSSNQQGNNDNDTPQKCPYGMCVASIKESAVSVTLGDIPVGYVPPIGPRMTIGLSYNQREDSQPANFDYYNIGQKWSLNWLSYIIDDPTNPGANVSRILGAGGAFYYLGYDTSQHVFAAQDDDGSILSIASSSPVSYRRQLRDGSFEIYEQSDGSTSYPRKVFLTQVVDPQGNAASLHYDSQRRLTSITDATGRNTTFSYNVAGRPLLVSAITDPFGRSAHLAYDSVGRLSSITDTIGITSSFTYDANSLISALTTPYGTSHFIYSAPGGSGAPRFAQITDPLGNKEREEWLEPSPTPSYDPSSTVPVGMPLDVTNGYLQFRNSFHWDKSAYVAAGCTDTGGCDYTKARVRHFVHMPGTSIKGTAIESEKYPLENRVWYVYPGQTSGQTLYGGTYDRPIGIGRVLDDGSSQVSSFDYDENNNLSRSTDPTGRTTYYAYADGIDVAAISQTIAGGAQSTLAQFVYNGHHRPISYTDAAGRTTTFEYNAVGQRASMTDALGEKTTYQYDANSNLSSITNANNATAASYTYDAANRVRTYTDSEGWTVTFDYDAADRVTKITYPDGTSKKYTYNRLDLASYQDREGRLWQYQYDANRRLTATIDPAHHTTGLGYDPSGNLTSLTDPKSNVTSWAYDVQDRQISKTYADNSIVTYSYENTTSRLKSTLDALGQTKQYSYAIDNNLAGLTYLNAVNPTPNVSFGYDPYFSRIVSMTDGVGTTTYTYNPSLVDGAQLLSQECFTATGATTCSHTISYGYDALGRPASRQISGSGTETWAYDAIGRVTNHSSDLGAFQMSYLGQTGQLTERQLLPTTSTLKTVWSYLDNAHDRRLAGIANTGLTNSQFTNFIFQTTPENFITGIMQTSDATILEPSPSSQAIAFNNLNEITTVSDQAYSYDANGNLLTDGEHTYSWDADNRLAGVAYLSQPGKVTKFEYDGSGRRVEIDETPAGGGSALTHKYLWCGTELCQLRDGSYSIVRDYAPEGELRLGSPNLPLYYGIDQISSVRRVFENAAISPSYDYDPWGDATGTTTPTTSMGYAKMLFHSESGISLTEYRAYIPAIGLWMSRDPAGEDTRENGNLYDYVRGNPISFRDRFGLQAVEEEPDDETTPEEEPGLIGPPWQPPPQPGTPAANECTVENPYGEYPGNRPPYTSTPGTTLRGGTQSRTYGPNGYPLIDRDLPHPDEKGLGNEDHSHDWSGPSHLQRGLSREPEPGDPPVPRGPNK